MAGLDVTSRSRGVLVGLSPGREQPVPAALPVEGEIPAWLCGTLIRNGPATWEAAGTPLRHWFDGHAMLHAFTVADGSVTYASRWLDTRARRAARDGEMGYSEFATDPCRSIFQRFSALFRPQVTDNANVNVVRLGDEHVAMTETPMPVRFDPDTLETLGDASWTESIPGHMTTAHPHAHPVTGELVNHATHVGRRSSYRLYAVPPGGGAARRVASVPVRRPAYLHSFGITGRHALIAEFPLRLDPLKLVLGRAPFIECFRWDGDEPTRLLVVDLDDGRVVAEVDAAPRFAFHHVNAWDEGDELVADLVAYDDPEIIRALYVDPLRTAPERVPAAQLVRYRIDVSRGAVREEVLADERLELPRIDYGRRNGRRHRVVYGVGAPGPRGFLDRLVKVDVDDGSASTWRQDGCWPGEPVYVAAPGARDEDDGVALSVVLDEATERSFLLVLDARTWRERARAAVPAHVPFGFHGQFYGAGATRRGP
jgi:beta,beta-carotene 9',10'-dioxygenase